MIDNLTILISTLMTVYVVWRAAVLDRKRAWYPSKEGEEEIVPPKRQFGWPPTRSPRPAEPKPRGRG